MTILPFVLLLVVGGVGSAAAQLTGTVVDDRGRPLPFVVVVSRTGNGFLGTRTDLHGRFEYPGRPHGSGHLIDASSAGFRGARYRLQGGETDIRLVLIPARTAHAGWTLGLPIRPTVQVETSDGAPVDPARLEVGVDYRVRIGMDASDCTRASDWVVERSGDEVLIAIAAFTRRGSCGEAVAPVRIPRRFERSGPVRLRVVGRTGDVVLDVLVLDP